LKILENALGPDHPNVAIATVPIPRLLPELLKAVPASTLSKDDPSTAPPSLRTVGEVDFKAALAPLPQTDQLALRAPENRDGHWQFDPLPGIRAEIVAINDSFEERFPEAQRKSLRKDQATKQAVCEAMPYYTYLHLATHGFFYSARLSLGPERRKQQRCSPGHGRASRRTRCGRLPS
jgi:hypothetical protein